MSWKSGTYVAEPLWEFYKKNLPDELLKPFAENLVEVLSEQDWDSVGDLADLAVMVGYLTAGTCECGQDATMHPDEFDGKCWDCQDGIVKMGEATFAVCDYCFVTSNETFICSAGGSWCCCHKHDLCKGCQAGGCPVCKKNEHDEAAEDCACEEE